MTHSEPETAETRKGPWCTMCGYVAAPVVATLDPDRPVGICRRGEPDRKGCGRVIASYTLAEAEQAYRTRRRKLTEARHKQHPPDDPRKWATWCKPCDDLLLARSLSGTYAGPAKGPGAARKVVW